MFSDLNICIYIYSTSMLDPLCPKYSKLISVHGIFSDVHVHIDIYICIHIYTYLYICINVSINIYLYEYTFTYVYVCI
jgi:hypothetical protein